MQPYRSQPHEHYRVTFGDERPNPLLVVGAVLALALSVGTILYGLSSGGHSVILFVSLGGLLMLFRRRGGSLEYARVEGELVVRSRALVGSHEDRVRASEVEGLAIVRNSSSGSDLVLQLKGGGGLQLLRSPNEADLEPARATVQAFLDEHRLLPTAHLGEDGPEEDGDEDESLDAREADQHR
jgi:hypothetical protein